MFCVDKIKYEHLAILSILKSCQFAPTLLEKKCNLEPFLSRIFRTLGEKGSQKGSLHVQEPKKVPYIYITKNGSKEPKKVLRMVLKINLEPFREPLKVPPVGQQKNLFF